MSGGSAIIDTYMAHRAALVDFATPIVGDRTRAEDVVQEAYLRLARGNDAPPKTIDNPVAYLYRIVRNLAIDSYRKRQREGRVMTLRDDATLWEAPDDTPTPETAAAARDEFRLLQDALDELPERTRIALEMRRFGGFKLHEIASHLGISQTTAHDIIVKGIAHCRRRVRPGT